MLTQEICDPLDRTREGAKQMFSFDECTPFDL